MEVDTKGVHSMYQSFVNSGLAFGALRWLCTLQRQCERIASVLANNVPSGDSSGEHPTVFFHKQTCFVFISVWDHMNGLPLLFCNINAVSCTLVTEASPSLGGYKDLKDYMHT